MPAPAFLLFAHRSFAHDQEAFQGCVPQLENRVAERRRRRRNPPDRRDPRPRAHDQPGRADLRQPELAARPARAGRRCSRTSSCARRSPTSTTSASPSASCTRAARRRTATSSCTRVAGRATPRAAFLQRSGERRRRCSRASRPSPAARARSTLPRDVRGFAVKFYTERGQLRPGRQQHPGVLHPGRDQVPRPGPRGEDGAGPRLPAGGIGARHVLGLRLADARVHAHDHVGDVRPHDPALAAHDRRLRRPHLPAGQRQGQVDASSSSTGARSSGLQSIVWDEAVKITGADPDFHRRDLFEAIDSGRLPRVGARRAAVRPRRRADGFDFDILDATKLIPEELVPLRRRSAGWCSTATRTTSSPRPSRSRSPGQHRARASTSPTIRCCRAGCSPTSTPSCRGWAARTSTRSRSTRPSARSQLPARRHMQTASRQGPRQLRAEQPRSPDGGPREDPARGFRSFAGASTDERATSCACGRRASPTTTARRGCSSARMTRAGAAHIVSAFALRARQGRDGGDPHAHARPPAIIDRALGKRVAAALGMEGQAETITPAREPIDLDPSPALSLSGRPSPPSRAARSRRWSPTASTTS